MMRIVRLAVVALVLYVVVNESTPWIKDKLGSGGPDAAASGPVRCVFLADEANEKFGDRVGRVSGPGADPAVWESFLGEIRGRVSQAQSQCHCEKESCRKALEAMISLEDLLNDLDNRFRGGVMPRGAVSRQVGINENLNEARVLAREGK